MKPLFAYGTLLDPGVQRRLLPGLARQGPRATLHGFRRRPVAGADYPGLERQSGACVRGRVLWLRSAAALAVLDDYEGAEYRRQSILVSVGGRLVRAECYLTLPTVRLAGEPWRPLTGRRREDYLRRQLSPSGSSRRIA